MVGLIIALMIALGGGASVVAESSVPGDVLYGVKTHVNEQVRGMIATSGEAKAEWQVKLAERRLDEAAKLEAKGNLDADVAAKLGSEFSAHEQTAAQAVVALTAAGHADIADKITAHLTEIERKHADIFASNDAQASMHAKAFVIPHILEKSGVTVRESATGQASGKRGMTADVDGDGRADVEVHSDSGASASGSANTEIKTGSASVRGGVKFELGE